ncbi:Terpene synthase [Macleaya cordata]|uniref:Terpene synthase n=1 Tax=Macleaya cordata TaxID=56857 RepID=A0A200RDZ8_MACCD|nr:Terpene synthase [Macleaya cordata]
MASHLLVLPSNLSSKDFQSTLLHSPLIALPNARRNFHVRCIPTSQTHVDTTIARRSANYQPNIWDEDFVQSLTSDYTSEIHTKRAEMLKEDVRHMFDEAAGVSSSSLKLIDTIQRLGLNYHFDDEIKVSLDTIMSTKDKGDVCHQENDLYTRALRFRLLRQHGYEVSQDVLKNFKEEIMMRSGDLKAWTVRDVEGMLSLYKASFYAFEGEEILDEAQEFTTTHLKEQLMIKGNSILMSMLCYLA